MRRRLVGTVLPLMLCAAAVAAVPTAAVSATSGRLLTTTAGQALPMHGGTTTSLNWAGYAVTPSSPVTAVTSTFRVPTATLLPPGFAATWTGIGGYDTSDLVQAGVSEMALPDNPLLGSQYAAWYEILPAAQTPIDSCTGDPACTVRPGDKVSVAISQAAPGQWAISIKDPTQGWSWARTIPYASSRSSAEWIHEAPTLITQTLLANTGVTRFGPKSTYTDGSGTHTIAEGNPTQINLSPGVINEATTSPLAADGQSFNVCAYQQTCPAP